MDARRGPFPYYSLQNDGNNDAGGLRLRGWSEALEDDRDGEIGSSWSPELHGDIDVQKGDSIQSHDGTGGEWHGYGGPRGTSQLRLKGSVPQWGRPGCTGNWPTSG
jgi:hypothetical protein